MEGIFDMAYEEDDELYHYGTKRHSGRYPYGSGEDPYQHESSFLSTVKELRSQGMSDTEIAKAMGMSTTEWRARRSIEKNRELDHKRNLALDLHDKGYSNVAIAERMDIPESSVRNLLKAPLTVRKNKVETVADVLKDNVDKKGYIDVGKGVNLDLNTSETNLKVATQLLKDEGYVVHNIKVLQLGTNKLTEMKVLCPPGTTIQELNANRDKIKTITDYLQDDGDKYTVLNIEPPKSVSSDRIKVRYSEEGGSEMDGVIQLRRGVNDISLGEAQYAQVRIAVDGTHYLKGMAMYTDDLPPGIDICFNTNKHKGTPLISTDGGEEVLKPMKSDPDNPFGATIKRQMHYKDENGIDNLSSINIVNEEGDWGSWSKTLASQMLSKQTTQLAEKQLALSLADKKSEFMDISNITIPEVRKKFLEEFAENCDAASVDLKAAPLPRQASQVILPVPQLKDTEIFAPNYRDGEEVVLIRYPHGGTFEIPRLTVNNKQKDADKVLHNAKDAVGINSNVAKILSGADFDGDTVLVIPTNNVNIRNKKPFESLKDFDPSEKYKLPKDAPKMKEQTKQTEMGKISNLITDMTLKGASDDEIERAVKHSMVVIDAVKHHLDYKQSYIDNNIDELKALYQAKPSGRNGGASTLISKASSTVWVPERKENYRPDPETGEKTYKETGRMHYDKNGKLKTAESKVARMEITKDARTLSSGTKMENIYADYANEMKALANQARKESLSVKSTPPSPSAKNTYAKEVAKLNASLNLALKNAPRERQAQLVANEVVRLKKQANPDMNKDELKRVKNQALAASRARLGASKKNVQIQISDKEWEAIESRAISGTKLKSILDNTDLDSLKERVMPRATNSHVSDSKINLAKRMSDSGYTTSEIADRLGISTSSVNRILN